MQAITPTITPWYTHRWPWLLMVGPATVMVTGSYTMWLAYTHQDALVVDDYYKQGKAINQDLRRDRIAASMQLQAQLRYDAAEGVLHGTLAGITGGAQKLHIGLIHSTLPKKDLRLDAVVSDDGRFSVSLPVLDIAQWQVVVEDEARTWRLKGLWAWPQQPAMTLSARVADNN